MDDLLEDDDQLAMEEAVSLLIRNTVDLSNDNFADAPVQSALWTEAANQGWFVLDLPEEHGGLGLSLVEQTLVFREIGRGLAPGPFLANLLAAHLLSSVGDAPILERVASGLATVGLGEALDVTGELSVGGLARSFDSAASDYLLCVGVYRTQLFERSSVHVVRDEPCFDPSAHLTEFEIIGDALHSIAANSFDAYRYGQVLVAAMLSGIAEATRDKSVSYVQQRNQFGVPIGSFQAVKHRCADQAVRAEAATSLTTLAALHLSSAVDDATLLTTSARMLAATYAINNALDNIQNHGAVGFIDENDAHLYLKRAQLYGQILGSPGTLRGELLHEGAGTDTL